MPTPHPLATVAQYMVREQSTRRSRSTRAGRRWFRRRHATTVEPVGSRAPRPVRAPDGEPAAPPGLALPLPVRLPRPRVSPEQAGSSDDRTVVRGA